MVSSIRRNIKTDISKNRSLKDILSPTASALEIISVQPLTYNVYNTKTIAIIEEDGVIEKRSLVYNRLNVNLLLQSVSIVGNTINEIIDNLNDLEFDFTTDDLDLVNGMLVTKPTSLGYYGAPILVGEILLEANVDTMMLLRQEPWASPLFDIVINDVFYSMSNVKMLDTSSHVMFDRDATANKSPVPIDLGFPAGLRDLVDIYHLPESGHILFRNKTDQELHVKLLPRNSNWCSDYDHLNQAVFYDADGNLNFLLTPLMVYNKETDDLVVRVGFNPETTQTGNYPMMIGINPHYFYLVSPGDFVEIETTLTPDSASNFAQTGTNPVTGAGIWRFDLFSDLDPDINDPAITGIRYIWIEFEGPPELQPTEVRVRSNRPIHQMELWNIIQVHNWGKYVVDQPYEVGDDVAASPMKSILTDMGEDSYTLPGSPIISYGFFNHPNHPTPTFNVYEYVKRGAVSDYRLFITQGLPGYNYKPREEQISDYFLNKPKLLSNAIPIFNDPTRSTYSTSAINVELKTLEVRLKAEVGGGGVLKTLASLFPAEQSKFIKRDLVGSMGLPSKGFLSYQFDSATGEDVYTVDVAGFKASGNYGPTTPYTQNDLRLLLKANWSEVGTGKVLMKVKGIGPTNAVVHNWQDVVDTNIFGNQANIWRDFIIFSESLHLGGLVPHRLDLALLSQTYKYYTGYRDETWLWGYAGQMIRNYGETVESNPTITQTFEGATNTIDLPLANVKNIILDRNGNANVEDISFFDYPDNQACTSIRPRYPIGSTSDLVHAPDSIFTKEEKLKLLNINDEYNDVYFLIDDGNEKQNITDIVNAVRKATGTLVFNNEGVDQAFNNGFDLTKFLQDGIEKLLVHLETEPDISNLSFDHEVIYNQYHNAFSAPTSGLIKDYMKLFKMLNPTYGFESVSVVLTLRGLTWIIDNPIVNGVQKTSQKVFNLFMSVNFIIRQNEPTPGYTDYAVLEASGYRYSFHRGYNPSISAGQGKFSLMPEYENKIFSVFSIEGDASVLESRAAIEYGMPDGSTKIYTTGNTPTDLAEPVVPFLKKSGNQVGTLLDYYSFYRVISSLY